MLFEGEALGLPLEVFDDDVRVPWNPIPTPEARPTIYDLDGRLIARRHLPSRIVGTEPYKVRLF